MKIFNSIFVLSDAERERERNCNDSVVFLHKPSDAREVHLRLDDYDVHDVGTTLKRYFRSLQEPLLTTFLYAKWTNTCSKLLCDLCISKFDNFRTKVKISWKYEHNSFLKHKLNGTATDPFTFRYKWFWCKDAMVQISTRRITNCSLQYSEAGYITSCQV